MIIDINDIYFADKMKALEALYSVYDPELFVNIVDLGLVYDIDLSNDKELKITMTLSTPHCPLGEAIQQAVKNTLSPLFLNKKIETKIVWEPAWSIDKISDAGKKEMGIL